MKQALFAACAWMGFSGATSAADDVELMRLGRSVLRIEAPLPMGGFSMGSGVALTPDTVVTNCHVTQRANAVNVVRGGVRYPVNGQLAEAEQDLCLLHVPGLDAPPVGLGSASTLRVGKPLAALGFTGGVGLQRSRGEVLSLHPFQGANVIRSSTWFNSGASGGALFSEDGDLVGLLTFRLRGGLAHYYAAPIDWIAALQARAASFGFDAVHPLPAEPRPYWQLPGDQQPRFLQVASMMAAHRWSALFELADSWLRADASQSEAWRALGEALANTGKSRQARVAVACAVALERAIGRVPAAVTDSQQVAEVQSRPVAPPSSDQPEWPTPCPVAL